MKTFTRCKISLLTATLCLGTPLATQAAEKAAPAAKSQLSESLTLEVRASLTKGVEFLLGKQLPDGSWLQHPAVTALACAAIFESPMGKGDKARAAVNKGLDFVVKSAKPDGSIWNTEAEDYPNYSTSISLIALALVNRPQDAKVIRAARDFILDSQFREEVSEDAKTRDALAPTGKPVPATKQVAKSDPNYGGVGYGKAKRPDLSNTQWALEALALTDHLDREPLNSDPAKAKKADLAWDRAIQFLSRCQNLKETNDQPGVATDPGNRGGFVYMPGESKAGEDEVDGQKALRSYGSMTYAGLKSMIYAKMKKDDPRVLAAVDWIKRNYTFDENPGLGAAGLYYYLHTSSKALAVLGTDTLTDKDGKKHLWREELATSIIQRQRASGAWFNENGRWWENQPDLVTAYVLLSLEIASGVDAVPGL